MTIYLIPILLKVSQSITHRMSIFTGQYRTYIIRPFGYLEQAFPTGILSTFLVSPFRNSGIQVFLFHTSIETADHIDRLRIGAPVHPLCPFIMNRTSRIEIMKPSRNCSEIRPISTFITHTPNHYARMVLIPFRHPDGTIHKSSMPIGSARQSTTQTMLLYIRLIHNIKSQTIA